jgi:large subunit ribosomal protein L21
MYAILQQSGHQYRVTPGDRLVVDRLSAEVGSMVALEPVVLLANDDGTQVGTPVVDGVRVAALVVSHDKGAKIRVFKYKAKKRYRRTHGHRSAITELRIEAVLAAGEALPQPKPKAKPAAKADEPAAAKPARARTRAKAAVETPEAETPEAWSGTEAPEVPETQAEIQAEAPTQVDAGTPAPADAEETAAAKPATPAKRAPRAKKPATETPPAATDGDASPEA